MNQTTSLKSSTLTAAQMEQHIAQVQQDIIRYREIEKSAELSEYLSLQKVVEAPEFQKNKKYLLTRKYSDTEEYTMMRRYRRLKLAPVVHAYFLVRSYPNFKEYLAFAESDRYALLNDKEALKASPELKKFRFIDRSLALRNYKRYKKSKDVQDYLRLRVEVKEEDFVKRNAFWSNPRRWYTTDESKQDARYMELKASKDIQFFLSQDAKQIAEWESYKTLYKEEFDLTNMEKIGWAAGFHYNNKSLKTDHSYITEQQAYNKGQNTNIANSALTIETRKEKVSATAWDAKKGFVPKDFAWTSDVMQGASACQESEGLWMAKVHISGKAHAAVYLNSGDKLPIVKMMQWDGKQVSVGMQTEKEGKQTVVSGVNAGKWYVFSALISGKEIVWYVNNQEVMRSANILNGVKVFPVVTEYIPVGATAGTGKVEVDWIRVYNK